MTKENDAAELGEPERFEQWSERELEHYVKTGETPSTAERTDEGNRNTMSKNDDNEWLREENKRLTRQVEDLSVELSRCKSGIVLQRLAATVGPMPDGATQAGARRFLESIMVPADAAGARQYPKLGDVCCAVEDRDAVRAALPGVAVIELKKADLAELEAKGLVGGAA